MRRFLALRIWFLACWRTPRILKPILTHHSIALFLSVCGFRLVSEVCSELKEHTSHTRSEYTRIIPQWINHAITLSKLFSSRFRRVIGWSGCWSDFQGIDLGDHSLRFCAWFRTSRRWIGSRFWCGADRVIGWWERFANSR